VYTTPPPAEDSEAWSVWVPVVLIEVISAESRDRDREQKAEEYLAFGVREYWIFDAERREMVVLQRFRGRWREHVVRPPAKYTTKLFPGLKLDCGQVFAAAAEIEE
jgi:Uma2 family endonuclease